MLVKEKKKVTVWGKFPFNIKYFNYLPKTSCGFTLKMEKWAAKIY